MEEPVQQGHGVGEGGRPEEQPAAAHHLEGHEAGEGHPGPTTGLQREAVGGPPPPALSSDHLTDAVVETPGHEGPGGTVPQAPQQHGDDDVEADPPLRAPVAAEGDVEVVAQPVGQRHVPPAPEVLEGDGGIGPVEVLGEAEAQQQGDADGDVGVAAEVGVDLDGVPPDGHDHLRSGVLVGVGEDRVDHVGGEVGGQHHLLGQPGGDQPEGLHVVDVVRIASPADLGQQLGPADDGAGHQVGEEGEEDGQVDRPGRLQHPPVDVHHVADRHEGEEGDGDGQRDVEQRQRAARDRSRGTGCPR